jgi:hypothetical protein
LTQTIKVEVDDELARQFRRKAMERNGYKKGAIKKALVEAMKDYLSESDGNTRESRWKDLKGILKSDKDSVWLQHHAWDKVSPGANPKRSNVLISKRRP